MHIKSFNCYYGKVNVTIGDVFKSNGIGRGEYTVVGWGSQSSYSPSGLGGTTTVFVRDPDGICEEWCGDSVASGIYETKNSIV